MSSLEKNNNSLEISTELLENLIENTENVSNQEILEEFINFKNLVRKNGKIDDLAKNSVYIENAIGKIYTFLLQKLDNKDLENFDISGEDTELKQGDTNYFRFIKEIEELEEKGKKINTQNIGKLLGFLDKIINNLYKNKFIQKDLSKILEKLISNNITLKRRLTKISSLNEDEYGDKEFSIKAVKDSSLEKEKEDIKKESNKRKTEFNKNKFFRRISRILKSDEIEVDEIETLQEVDSKTTILTFHKVMKDEIINILSRLGVNIKFSRKGFTSIKLPTGEKIVFLPTKDIGSTTNFSDFETYQEEVKEENDIFTVEDYIENTGEDIEYVTKKTNGVFFLGGKDMTDLFKSKEGKDSMVKLADINSLLAFGAKAEFLLASDEDSLNRIIQGQTLDILATKYTGVGDKMIDVLLKYTGVGEKINKFLGEYTGFGNKIVKFFSKKIKLKYYGSNSEGGIQKEKSQNRNKVVMNLEAVQSGASMKDTKNYIYRKEEIDGEEKVVVYYPSMRGKNGDFEKKDIRYIFDKEKKYLWLFDALDVVQTEMNLELSQVNIETKDKVEDIIGNIPKKSVKSFLINMFNYRGKELAKFNRIETEPGERPLIELTEESLKDEKLMKQVIELYKEVYGRIGYDEEYEDEEVYNIIKNIIEKGGTWILKQNNYEEITSFIASIDLNESNEIKEDVKQNLKEKIGNENKNYYIAETGSSEEEREEGDFQDWLKQIIKDKGNYIARTNLLDSKGEPNEKIIKMYKNVGFDIIKGVNDKVEKPGTTTGEKNSKVYLVYKNK